MISTIVPCYNAEPFLRAALDSIASQSVPPDEIIVVDDGSTDASAQIASGYGGLVRVISQSNSGISAARNSGLHQSQGTLVTFLDADDVWPRDSVERRLALMEPGIDIVAGDVEHFTDLPASSSTVDLPGIGRGRLAGALLVRRTVFDRVGDFDRSFAMGETMDWIARVDAAGCKTAWTNGVVLRRRVHSSNSVYKTAQLKTDYLKVLRASIARQRSAATNLTP